MFNSLAYTDQCLTRLRQLTACIAVVFLIASDQPNVEAGTLVIEHLASIREVRVVVGVGGLLYDPTPGLDTAEFEERAQDLASSALKGFGIPCSDSSAVVLLLTPRSSRASLPAGHRRVELRAELREPARLSRLTGDIASEPLVVTTWRTWLGGVVRNEQGEKELLRLVQQAAVELGQASAEARDAQLEIMAP